MRDYSWIVERIRYNRDLTGDIETAVDLAISELTENSVIKPFLMEHKAEVKNMCITEYDEKKTMNMFKEEGREEERLNAIRNMMEALKMTSIDAMKILKIPASEQERLLAML